MFKRVSNFGNLNKHKNCANDDNHLLDKSFPFKSPSSQYRNDFLVNIIIKLL